MAASALFKLLSNFASFIFEVSLVTNSGNCQSKFANVQTIKATSRPSVTSGLLLQKPIALDRYSSFIYKQNIPFFKIQKMFF
jgi:hypothetical protein